MRAMVLNEIRPIETEGKKPLELADLPLPVPAPDNRDLRHAYGSRTTAIRQITLARLQASRV